MSNLAETKAWMRWWGWTNDGGPGAVKLDADELPIAEHGDPAWNADVDKAYEMARKTRLADAHSKNPPEAEHG